MAARIHYLTLQECKRVFFRSDYGVIRFHDMIANAEQFSLQRVYVLGVSMEGIPLRCRYYFLAENLPSVSGFLREFWRQECFVGLRTLPECPLPEIIQGKPDEMIIDQRMANCLTPDFFAWLKNELVTFRFSDTRDRKFTATVRQHQEFPHVYAHAGASGQPMLHCPNMAEPYPLTLEAINAFMAKHVGHLFDVGPTQRQFISERYLAPVRLPSHEPPSPDLVLLPNQLCVRSGNDVEIVSLFWHASTINKQFGDYGFAAINMMPSVDDDDDDDDLADDWPDVDYYRREFMVALRCHAAVHKQLAEMLAQVHGDQDYLAKLGQLKRSKYRGNLLTKAEETTLFDLLGLSEINTSHPSPILPGIYDLSTVGINDTVLLWELITQGGDVDAPFEVRPVNGSDDPAYRIFAVRRCSGGISHWLLARRASRACAALDQDRCINFEPGHAEYFPASLYRKALRAALTWNRAVLGNWPANH